MIAFLIIFLILAFILSQLGKEKKVYKRSKNGQFAKVAVKKEKRIVPVKEGQKIVSYFSI